MWVIKCVLFITVTLELGDSSVHGPATNKVGRMLSPVAYGHIHFFRPTIDIRAEKAAFTRNNAGRRQMMIERQAPEDILAKFNKLTRKAAERMERLNTRVEQTLALTKTKPREKRAAVVVAAVALVSGVLIAMGLGVVNAAQVNDLQTRAEKMKSNADELLVSVKMTEIQVKESFAEMNQSLGRLGWERFLSEEAARMRDEVEEIQDRLDAWIAGYFHLIRGQLDPTFVSMEDLMRGLDLMTSQADTYGMIVAPFEGTVEAFFTMPISVVLNGTGIHMFVSVPMIPAKAPVFDLIRITHHPIHLKDDHFLEIMTGEIYLAVDQDRSLHREMTTVDLMTCDRFKDTFLCRMTTFSRKPDSCASGLMFGDKAVIKEHCLQKVSRKEIVVVPTESHDVVVWSQHRQTIVKRCPGLRDAPLERFQGSKRIGLEKGCHLRTAQTATFLTHRVPQQEVSCVVTNFTIGDFWDRPQDLSIQIEHLKSLKLREIDLRELQRLVSSKPLISHDHLTFATGLTLAIATMTMSALAGSFVRVWLRRLFKRKDNQ